MFIIAGKFTDDYKEMIIDQPARKGGNAFMSLGGINLSVLVCTHKDMGVLSADSGICRIGMDYRSLSQVLDDFIQGEDVRVENSSERLLRVPLEMLSAPPTRSSQMYLDLAKVLNLPALKATMILTKFRASTKLDLTVNLK